MWWCVGARAADGEHAVVGERAGTEADAWRAAVSTDPVDAPRPGRQDHRHAA